MRKLIATLLLCVFPALGAAINATVQWDVRTTGSDSNSGGFDPSVGSPGTDESQQNSGTSMTLVVAVTTTQATSTPAFSATTHGPGNTVLITGGAGCTTGLYEELSQSGGTGTFNASFGTAAAVCTGIMGGSDATFCSNYSSSNCTAGAMAFAVSNNTIWMKTGTYTWTFAQANSNAASLAAKVTINGYNTTHGDISPSCLALATCTRPVIAASFGSANMFNAQGALVTFVALQFTETCSASCFSAISLNNTQVRIDLCKFDWSAATGGTMVFAPANGVNNMEAMVTRTEFSLNSTANGVYDNAGQPQAEIYLGYVYCHGGATCLYDGNNGGGQKWTVTGSTFSGNSRAIYAQSAGVEYMSLTSNNFYNSTNENVLSAGSPNSMTVANNVFYGGTFGISISGGAVLVPYSQSNAYGNLSTANYSGWIAGANSSDVTLTANPFTAPGSGNFALNATSGGGAAIKAAGFPGVTAFGTGAAAVGALQPTSSGGASPHALVQ